MKTDGQRVGLLSCRRYDRRDLADCFDRIAAALGLGPFTGHEVLLKPNLVSSRRPDGPVCTDPGFIAAAAEWFLDHGARVKVGDSPAFGTARGVMESCGIAGVLKKMPVRLVEFSGKRRTRLACGVEVGISSEALDCDLLVNLPKVKAHGQLLVSLGVKNLFGTVTGFQKPLLHARYGDRGHAFEAMLVDLLDALPASLTLVDGVVAMHRTGPVKGDPYPLGLVAGSENPVAVDTALLAVLGARPVAVPLARECLSRGLRGARLRELEFPLLAPHALRATDFVLPDTLQPVSFHPWRLSRGWLKRVLSRCRGVVSRRRVGR